MAIRLEGANAFYDHFDYLLTSAVTGEGMDLFFEIVKRKVDISSLLSTRYVAVGTPDDADVRFKSCVKCKKNFPEDNGHRVGTTGEFDYCLDCAKAEEKARTDAEMARLRKEKEASEEARKKYCDHKTCLKKFIPGTGHKGKKGEYC